MTSLGIDGMWLALALPMTRNNAGGSRSMYPARLRGFDAGLLLILSTLCAARNAKAQRASPPHDFDIPPPNGAARVNESPQPGAARAQSLEDAEPAPRRWYGYQTLALDGVALGFFVAGLSTTDGSGRESAAGPLLGLSAAIYFLGAPAVHVAHSNWTGVGLSAASRVVLPLLGGALGAAGDNCDPHNDGDLCGAAGPALGALLGLSAAIALDAAVFAREPRAEAKHDSPSAPSTPSTPPRATATPFARADKNRVLLGVSGAF